MGTIELDLLPVFIAVAETSSLSAAAAKARDPEVVSESLHLEARAGDGRSPPARNSSYRCDATLLDVEGALAPADRDALLALKAPHPLSVQPKQPLGAIAANTEDLGPADVVHFGGKASNYGLLRDAIPDSSQEAIALSFDLWDGFLDQASPRPTRTSRASCLITSSRR